MDFQDLLAQASHNARVNTKHVRESERKTQMRKDQTRQRYESELQREREERKRRAPPKVETKFVIPKKKPADDVRTASSSRMNEKPRSSKSAESSKRPPAGVSTFDFKKLMETAQQNRDVTTVAARTAALLNGEQRPAASTLSDSREVMKRSVESTRRVPPVTKQQPASKAQQPRPSSSNPFEAADRRTLGPPLSSRTPIPKTQVMTSNSKNTRPMPSIPQPPTSGHSNASMFAAKREPRYLPGDMRYKPPIGTTSQSTNGNSGPKLKPAVTFGDRFRKIAAPSSVSSSQVNRERPAVSSSGRRSRSPSQRPAKMTSAIRKAGSSTGGDRVHGRPYDSPPRSSAAPSRRHLDRARDVFAGEDEPPAKHRKRAVDDRRSGRPLSHPGMFNKGRSHVSTSFISGGMHSDEDDEDDARHNDDDDEHDSEMDDFIDDTDVDNLAREDFEESLKLINPHYNKKKWEQRERMIDERQMHSRFRDVEAEEKQSSRWALYEDLREAKRGSKGIT